MIVFVLHRQRDIALLMQVYSFCFSSVCLIHAIIETFKEAAEGDEEIKFNYQQ